MQDGCFVEWRDMVADAARKGFAGEVSLQWNSYKILTDQMQQEWLGYLQKRRSMPRPRGNRRAPKTPEQRRKIAEAIAAKWLDQVRAQKYFFMYFLSEMALMPYANFISHSTCIGNRSLITIFIGMNILVICHFILVCLIFSHFLINNCCLNSLLQDH